MTTDLITLRLEALLRGVAVVRPLPDRERVGVEACGITVTPESVVWSIENEQQLVGFLVLDPGIDETRCRAAAVRDPAEVGDLIATAREALITAVCEAPPSSQG